MKKLIPPFLNWGDHPVVVIIVMLAALATIIGTVGPFMYKFIGASDVSETSSDQLAPGKTSDRPVNTSNLTEALELPAISANSEVAEGGKPRPDIAFECGEANVIDGFWHWSCHLSNESDRTIWWRDSFQNEGSNLGWYCMEDVEQTCKAATLSDEELDLSTV